MGKVSRGDTAIGVAAQEMTAATQWWSLGARLMERVARRRP